MRAVDSRLMLVRDRKPNGRDESATSVREVEFGTKGLAGARLLGCSGKHVGASLYVL